jgi:hypothetical protein
MILRLNVLNLPFGTAGIGRDDDGVLPVGNIVHDPLDYGWLGEQIIHWNIEKALQADPN